MKVRENLNIALGTVSICIHDIFKDYYAAFA